MKLFFILLIIAPSIVSAGTDYKYTITNMVQAESNGELKKGGMVMH